MGRVGVLMGYKPSLAELRHTQPPTCPAPWKEGPANARRRPKSLYPHAPRSHPHRTQKSLPLLSAVGEIEAQRVRLRFEPTGLKVTGHSSWASPWPPTLMFSFRVAPEASSWESPLLPLLPSQLHLHPSYPAQALSCSGASNLPPSSVE